MKYEAKMTWNGATVFDGKCSAVIANVLLQHVADNFVGTTRNHLNTVLPNLKMLANAKIGDSFRLPSGGDETGRFGYIVTCIRN